MEDKIMKLQELIDQSRNIVFFGGAGVSTESGIPDFRSKDGLYNQHDVQFDRFTPEYLLSHSCLYRHSEVFYEFYRQKLETSSIEPNVTHYKLAELEAAGKNVEIVTQNIDGLHQRAGSKKVYEVHGTTLRNYCDRCRKIYPADAIFKSTEKVPHCECGGMIRPDVTLYEESLPEKAWVNAQRALTNADMLIVAGTSLTVYPAAGMIDYYRGSHLVVINRDPLPGIRHYNPELVFTCGMGQIFSRIQAKKSNE